MPVRWLFSTSLSSLSRGRHAPHQQGPRQALQCSLRSRLYGAPTLSHNVHGLRWWRAGGPQARVHRTWVFRACRLHYALGPGVHASPLSTSASHSCADRNPGMWRLKRTFDSVSRAINSTHADLLSRILHLKSGPMEAGGIRSSASEAKGQGPGVSSVSEKAQGQQGGKEPKESTSRGPGRPGTEVADSSRPIGALSQTPWLFHPSKLPVHLGETYNYLAHHINEYFGNATKSAPAPPGSTDPKASAAHPGRSNQVAPPGAVPTTDTISPPSPKKGIGHYLSYPGPSVQAFVGSYITPLVPKFRPTSKGVETVKDVPPPTEVSLPKQVDSVEAREQKAADDRAKRLLLQREKIIARVSVDNRTRALVQALQRASDLRLSISRVEDLSYHLLQFPETRGVAVKEQLVPCLLRLRQAGGPALQAAVREVLALVGYADPVKGRGIRLLSIDGGGTRGVVALRTLRKLEELTGKPTYQLFDYLCGVSTGAILAFMLGVYQMSLDECEELYRRLGSEVFKQNVIVGTVKMGWSHAFYDSQIWEAILKEQMGSDLMVETSRNAECPKVAAVSTIVNRGTPLKAYVFRNYNLPPGVRSHYLGGCQHMLWQAIRASSAAPGYFQEFPLGDDLHQDGGLLVNNPTAVALHESQCLWPGTRLQCVVSLGTGRLESPGRYSATYTSLKTKLSHVISSATDTEEVHTMLDALLPPHAYFRFNPHLSEDVPLDEHRRERLALLHTEGQRYLERNEHKLQRAAAVLLLEKSALQRLGESSALRGAMLRGIKPVRFFSRS